MKVLRVGNLTPADRHTTRYTVAAPTESPLLLIIESPPFQSTRTRTFAARLASKCGCEALFVITAAIPLTRDLLPGELMVVCDHINLLGDSPLIGPPSDGSTFPFCDLTNAYDPALQDDVARAAEAASLAAHPGVYVASPLAERPDASALEILRDSGGHACGTGLVPHVLAARDASLKVAALSCLTTSDSAIVSGPPARLDAEALDTRIDRFSQLVGGLLGQWSRRGGTRSQRRFATAEDGDAKN